VNCDREPGNPLYDTVVTGVAVHFGYFKKKSLSFGHALFKVKLSKLNSWVYSAQQQIPTKFHPVKVVV